MRPVTVRDAPVNLTQGAYERLRADLLSCRIPPGARLKIQDLCQRLSVSLGAIREALSRLTSDGLVIAEPQRGFRAAPISPEDLQDLTKVRIEIDSLCLRQAIARGNVDWEARLVAAFHRLSRTPERAPDDPARASDDWAAAHRRLPRRAGGGLRQSLAAAAARPALRSERTLPAPVRLPGAAPPQYRRRAPEEFSTPCWRAMPTRPCGCSPPISTRPPRSSSTPTSKGSAGARITPAFARWFEPKLVARAGSAGDGQTRQARYLGLRPDQPRAAVRRERPRKLQELVA